MKKTLQPYFTITLCGLAAFAPVSFFIRALKNDIVALEYPINHFISQCIRNGETPYWFNTWGLGFPLHSNLTWGIFSTPQMAFNTLFNYNIHVLHFEFTFFILLAGWTMFYLLRRWLVKDEKVATLLAIAYMLSGFMVGSTQWLLYITAAAFIPLVIISLLALLEKPGPRQALQFAICYTLMFTSVYAAFNIISTYCLAIFLLAYFVKNRKEKDITLIRFRYLLMAAGFTLLLCGPCLYFTLELLQHIDRGGGIASGSTFFNSNYLHPAALGSMLLPFSSVKMAFANTEGTMLNSYAGLFVLATFPAALWLAFKEKKRTAVWLLVAALLFLFISFGAMTPLREALNVLPGFGYFRNPAIFRFYFILSLILFAAIVFRNRFLPELFEGKDLAAKLTRVSCWLLAAVCFLVLLFTVGSLKALQAGSLREQIQHTSYHQALALSAAIQLLLLATLLLVTRAKRWGAARLVLAADLVINTLVCTPYFSVSSYSLADVNRILRSQKGFPVQQRNPADVKTTYLDEKGNAWQNINVFSKEVSSNGSYRGPLVLSAPLTGTRQRTEPGWPLIFSEDDPAGKNIELLMQRPAHIRAKMNLPATGMVRLLQNYYPGWKAFINKKEVGIVVTNKAGMSVAAPAGESTVDFVFEKKPAWITALLLHLVVLLFGMAKLVGAVRKLLIRSSSPS